MHSIDIFHFKVSSLLFFQIVMFLKCGFHKKSFVLNATLVSCPFPSSLLGGCNSKPTQKRRCYFLPFHSSLFQFFPKSKIAISFHFHCYFLPLFYSTKNKVEGNSNFKITISFHFYINLKNCYYLPLFSNEWNCFHFHRNRQSINIRPSQIWKSNV